MFIAWLEGDLIYSGYWDSFPEEDCADGSRTDAGDSVHRRGRRVGSWANPEGPSPPESDPEEYYWAGLGQPRGDDANLKRLDV